ncbi:MAG TPA: hypothetical protein VNQ48_09140 [Microbacteriaceae bacterium]|nr:hypothetical protein [Microbacteriaceae bacterium]
MTPEPDNRAWPELAEAREVFAGLVSAYVTADVETVNRSNAAVNRYLAEDDDPARLHRLISAAAITGAALLTQLASHTGVSPEALIAGTAGIDLR